MELKAQMGEKSEEKVEKNMRMAVKE